MDLRAGELRKHGVRIRLQAQPFQILGMLLERPGEVVTREELRQALWAGDTFVDFDHGLNNAINRLRETLGDSAESPRFVETLPRRGYRFIAPVEVEKVGTNLGLPVHDAASLADDSEVFGAGLVSAQVGHTQGAPQREGNGDGKVEAALETTAVGRDLLTQPAAVSKRWRWLWHKVAIAAAVLAVLAAGFWWRVRPKPDPYAIAVLPFKNLSSEPNSDYFSDGLTDEIIRNLSIIDGLQVKSRTSSFAFKDKPRNIHEVGVQLGASLVLEGSVLRSGDNLRINAQLVRVSDDALLWSQRFDRRLKDIFAIQDEISRGIVNSLRLKLGRGQRRYETSVEAYDLYLRARAIDPPYQGVFQQQIDLFEEAVAKDPSFAPAYAGLATTYGLHSIVFPVEHAPDELARMRAAAEKAIELDPLLAEAHEALAVIFARDGQWGQAEKSFRRAIELDPNRSSTYLSYSDWLLTVLGRNDEALQQLRVAEKLDPLSPLVHRSLAYALIDVGRYEEAAQYCLKFPADHSTKWMTLARVRLGQGRTAEAIQILVNDQTHFIKNPQERGFFGYAYALSGRREEAEKMASAALYANEQALIFAGLGDKDRTLEALERMGALGPQRVGEYLNFPQMAFLRGDPRVKALRKKVGLPE
jgi:TolB-like protein/DNA-binding winged helix-turn-helix (wHTH) protein/predicted Zn-dependent protease